MNEWEWNLLEDKTGNLDHVEIDGIPVKTGDRVRLRPKGGGDILDILGFIGDLGAGEVF